ncbi:hypothetical protein [Polluticaenibacter yanchengensis]|uniref:DUF4292 domain-containing protein n=1 Tax=Polluticaenibacter yanchengensis TaxID=3014562 RepID=A0ABT4UM84_9BACT|nr:hypothetical protein [Chitinophagaceae bacterium LY-5]
MPKLINRILLFSSIVLITASCKSYQVQATRDDLPVLHEYNKRYFDDAAKDYIYKANIAIYGKELSGILIFKKIDEQRHRLVLTTDFGNKLMDVEISGQDFLVHFVMEDLNRKIILNTLKKDFRLLLQKHYAIERTYSNGTTIIAKTKTGGKQYLHILKADSLLGKVDYVPHRQSKLSLQFSPETTGFTKLINIYHHKIKLKIDLVYIGK